MEKKRKIIIFSICIVLLLMVLVFVTWAYTGPCDWIGRLKFHAPLVISYSHNIPTLRKNESFMPFAVIGDTQRTSFWECTIGREVNDNETKLIVNAIAVSKAAFLVFLGDMVFDGGNEKHWQYFDKIIIPFRTAMLPILPVLGNHEYWGNRASAKRFVEERFPEVHNSTWYSKQNGDLGMIFVNSNHGEVSNKLWETQRKWLESLISEWNSKENIKGILLFAHHPPYTNSVVASSDEKVRADIAETFCQTTKAMAMMTGHAHGYERFEIIHEHSSYITPSTFNTSHIHKKPKDVHNQTIQFIVSGGGGGPRPNGLRTKYKDAYVGPSPRPFNFLLVQPSSDGAKILTYGLRKGHTRTHLMEEINLFYPK